jgi:FAD/FMN-containing dehydrogenase
VSAPLPGGGEAWSNWAGSVRCAPLEIAQPAGEDALRSLLRRAAEANLCVRVVGSGHSFTPIAATDGILVSLDAMRGIVSCDAARGEARIRAGSKLHDLGEPLLERGLAMENLGDVDVQSLGGALATGTHGTGRALPNLSARVLGLRLLLASGEALECREEADPELLRAARVSLGLLGIVTEVRLALLPAYRLHERVRRMPVEDCLAELDAQVAAHRHHEFFWFPRQDLAEVKSLDPTDLEERHAEGREGERIGPAPRILPSVRELPFAEMEYAVPAEAGTACFLRVRERIRSRHPKVAWPVEYRTVASDDSWLSPAYGRDTVTISVHQDGRYPYRELFLDVEPILAEHGGRPHWGKFHTRRGPELAALYPRLADFLAVRARLDPQGRFLSDALRELFGL